MNILNNSMHSKVFLIIVQYIRMDVFFSEMAEYSRTHNGSSYRVVETLMNWYDAQVSIVAWSIVFIILQNRCLIQGISRFLLRLLTPNSKIYLMNKIN